MKVDVVRDVLGGEMDYSSILDLIRIIEDRLKEYQYKKKYNNLGIEMKLPYIPQEKKDLLFKYLLDRGILSSIYTQNKKTIVVLYDLSKHMTYKMGQKVLQEQVYLYKNTRR